MSTKGIVNSKFKHLPFPVCYACWYTKLTKRKTRDNSKHIPQDVATYPGQMVSVDQPISTSPGLIAQMTDILTTKRYKCATIYVDQYSRIGYAHLQKSISGDDTVEGKNDLNNLLRTKASQLKDIAQTME